MAYWRRLRFVGPLGVNGSYFAAEPCSNSLTRASNFRKALLYANTAVTQTHRVEGSIRSLAVKCGSDLLARDSRLV